MVKHLKTTIMYVVTTMCDDKFLNLIDIFYIKIEHNLCIINECLVAKNLLTNVNKMNEHSNVTTFVYALINFPNLCVCACVKGHF